MKYLFPAAALCCLVFLSLRCALTKPLDKAFTDAMAGTVARTELDTLSYRTGYNLAKGIDHRLLSDSTTLKLAALLDLLDEKLTRTGDRILLSATDSVRYQTLVRALGETLTEAINQKVLGPQTEARLKQLRDGLLTEWLTQLEHDLRNNLLGDRTRLQLAALRNELLGDSTRLLVGRLRGELTGEASTRELAALIDAALSPTIEKLDRSVNQNLKVTQKYANEIILALLAAACLIIAWVWYQRRRYLNLVKLLTVQINDIPDQKYYDELTRRIQKEAIKTDMEPVLRGVLKEQGL